MNITCSLHQKRCTHFCSSLSCKSSSHFLCPRCIRNLEQHIDHQTAIIDISRFDSIDSAISQMFQSSPQISQMQKTLDYLSSKNERLLCQFAQIASKFSSIKDQLDNTVKTFRDQSIQDIKSKDSDNNEDYQQKKLTKSILAMYKNLPQITEIMEVTKKQFKSLYRPLGKEIKAFLKEDTTNAVDAEDIDENQNIQNKIESVGKVITEKIVNLIDSLKDQINMQDRENKNGSQEQEISKDKNESQNECELSEIMNFSELFSSTSEIKQGLIIPNSQIPAGILKPQQEQINKLKQQITLLKDDSIDNNQNIEISVLDEKSQPKQFICEKKYSIELKDINILCCHQNMHLIMYSPVNQPDILNIYSLDHLFVTSTQVFKEPLISANINKEASLIVTASKYVCSLRDLSSKASEQSYELENESKQPIGKVQFQDRNEIVVIYQNNTVEVFSHRQKKYYKTTRLGQQLDYNNNIGNMNEQDQNDNYSGMGYFYKQVKSSQGVIFAIQLRQETKSINLLDGRSMEQLDIAYEKYSIIGIEVSDRQNDQNDSWKIISCGQSDQLRIYQINCSSKKLQLTQTIQTEHNSSILSTRLINSSQWIVTISADCTWKVFNLKSNQEVYSNSNDFQVPITHVEYFADKHQLVFIDFIGTLVTYAII